MRADDRRQKLRRRVRKRLERRGDILWFELRDSDPEGIIAELERSDGTEVVLVTLEAHPDGSEKLHWTYLGDEYEDQ